MALSLANVISTDTFSTWVTRTNEVIRDAAPAAGNFTTAGGTVTGNLTVSGDAVFNGNTTIVSKTTISTTDALIQLASNNEYSDTLDIGFFAHFQTGSGNNHTGLIRDAGTKEYYLFGQYIPHVEPTDNININHASFDLANVHVHRLTSNAVVTHSITATGDITSDRDITANAFIGDGSQLTNAGSTVATDTVANRELTVAFTGVSSGTMTSANVNPNFTFNPATGALSANAFIGDGSQLTNAGSTVASDSVNHDLFVPFTGISSGTMTSANVNSNFTFNPSTGTLSATAFSGDGSNLTNAGSTVATDTTAARDLFVTFTGVSSGTMTSANVNSTFTFNPGTGTLAANTVKTYDLQDSSGRTLIIRDSANSIVWGG